MTRQTTDTAVRQNFSRYPMLFVAVCFSLGILADKFAAIDLNVSLVACGVLAVAAMAFRKYVAATLFVGCAFAAAGMASFQTESDSVRADRIKVLYDNGTIASGSPVEIEGVLAGRPELSVDGEFLTLRADIVRYRGADKTVSGDVRIFVPDSDISNFRSEIS